ncbi:MAG: xanthine dehydrogenase family protein subunit M [Acidobacteriota bacterium]
MAVVHDMMPAFELFQPQSIEQALALLNRYDGEAWAFAGGLDSVDWFKDRIKRPKAVIDLGSISELRGVRSTADGLEIGAMTTLTEVISHPEIAKKYGLLSQASGTVATPQIRNQGTLGGNISQDTRCWYYRGGWPCYRAGGNICYADTPTSINREHCIFGADRCVAVNPSDTAPALIALDAKMAIRNRRGERVVDAEEFFIGPSLDITRMNVLGPGDLLTSIRIPSALAGARFYFEKVRDRQSWDFPLVNVASAMVLKNGVIERVRLAVNGVAPYPMRMRAVEERLRGQRLSEEAAAAAGEMAIEGAKPLRHNAYKLSLMRNLVRRAVRGAEA